jgi:hypothetical protein
VGEHNLIKMEGGDWNDAFDMAAERGESVAFSALYAGNLRILAHLCRALAEAGTTEVSLAEELLLLLDRSLSRLIINPCRQSKPGYRLTLSVSGNISREKRSLWL